MNTNLISNTELKARELIEAYRATSEWTVERQVLLQCLYVWWSRQFRVIDLSTLSGPLTGQAIPPETMRKALTRAVRAGLLRRVPNGGWELAL